MNPVLIRIPRTGTSSICIALGKHFDHYPASKIKREMGKEWDKSFKFTIVRNPYDRFLSMFKYFYKGSLEALFEEKFWEKDIRFASQGFYLDEPIDYIGRFEELNKSWDFICSKLGYSIQLPHLAKSKGKSELTDIQKEIVYKYYKKDFELFGY